MAVEFDLLSSHLDFITYSLKKKVKFHYVTKPKIVTLNEYFQDSGSFCSFIAYQLSHLVSSFRVAVIFV